MPITLTRQEMEEKLAQVFPPEQSASLVEVLDEIRAAEIERAADTRELKQGLTALTKEVRQLTEAQRRTDERVADLAEAQRRTDERLAAFQQRTDERFAELGRVVGVLAESVQGLQQRTDERFAELGQMVGVLAESVQRLQQAVGGLANRFGFDLEEFVAALLPPYLERHYGISNLTLERRYFDLGGGREEEVDLEKESVKDDR